MIVLLTDFGLQDGFVGVMKGVMAGIAPGIPIVDLSHEIPPQNLRAASFLLHSSWRFFPVGAVFVVVVDPAVGSERRGLAVFSQDRYFLGPDNGVMTPLLTGDVNQPVVVRLIENPTYCLPTISSTFHGRDVFAPCAAHLANHRPFNEVGSLVSDPVLSSLPEPRITPDGLEGEIVYIDRFGNLITNFSLDCVATLVSQGCFQAILEDRSLWLIRKTYSDVSPGKPCAVMGGFGYLELSISMGSAENKTGAQVGSRVWLKILP